VALNEGCGVAWLAPHDVRDAALPAPVRRLLDSLAGDERGASARSKLPEDRVLLQVGVHDFESRTPVVELHQFLLRLKRYGSTSQSRFDTQLLFHVMSSNGG